MIVILCLQAPQGRETTPTHPRTIPDPARTHPGPASPATDRPTQLVEHIRRHRASWPQSSSKTVTFWREMIVKLCLWAPEGIQSTSIPTPDPPQTRPRPTLAYQHLYSRPKNQISRFPHHRDMYIYVYLKIMSNFK
jgi:hypothetical protein